MLRKSLFLFTLTTHVASVLAAYDRAYFAGNKTNYFCTGKFGFSCPPPSVCVHDGLTDKYYCCGSGSSDAVCWTGMNVDCGGGNGQPSGAQQSCSSGATAFCCLKEKEQCTQTSNQINICWATAPNPVANLSTAQSNKTYSSLSSQNPSATTYSINVASLLSSATASSVASPSQSASSSSSPSPISTTTSTTPTDSVGNVSSSNDGGLSGGAIGGIVGGVVGGLALIGLIAFLLWRRKRASAKGVNSAKNEHTTNPYTKNGYQVAAAEAPGQSYIVEAPATEKYASYGGRAYADTPTPALELDGTAPVEMPANNPDPRQH